MREITRGKYSSGGIGWLKAEREEQQSQEASQSQEKSPQKVSVKQIFAGEVKHLNSLDEIYEEKTIRLLAVNVSFDTNLVYIHRWENGEDIYLVCKANMSGFYDFNQMTKDEWESSVNFYKDLGVIYSIPPLKFWNKDNNDEA